MTEYKAGDIIKGTVSGITKYGIFVHIDIAYDGLIHISEISNEYVNDIDRYVQMGETIYCQVLEVDEKTSHLRLSIKNINYKLEAIPNTIPETRKGFLPLKEALPGWIDEKLKEYKSKE
ncbi:MAG: S1 RNA-binding domain-containing protein [Bacilli bacterium]|nr:S1 RNA-binding domain-containing protein [Bacilli bacterium]